MPEPGPVDRAQQLAAQLSSGQGGDEHANDRTLWCVSERAQETTKA